MGRRILICDECKKELVPWSQSKKGEPSWSFDAVGMPVCDECGSSLNYVFE